jgi:hypothetical protein
MLKPTVILINNAIVIPKEAFLFLTNHNPLQDTD